MNCLYFDKILLSHKLFIKQIDSCKFFIYSKIDISKECQSFMNYLDFEEWKKKVEKFEVVIFVSEILSRAPKYLKSIFKSNSKKIKDKPYTTAFTGAARTKNITKYNKADKVDKILFYCNHKTNYKYTCPFHIFATRCNLKLSIKYTFYIHHNYNINLDKQRLSSPGKKILIEMVLSYILEKEIPNLLTPNLIVPKLSL